MVRYGVRFVAEQFRCRNGNVLSDLTQAEHMIVNPVTENCLHQEIHRRVTELPEQVSREETFNTLPVSSIDEL